MLSRRAVRASRQPGAAPEPRRRPAAGRAIRGRLAGIRVALPRRRGADSYLHSAKMERRRPGRTQAADPRGRSEEHTSELQSHVNLVCRLLLEKKNKTNT